MIFSELGADALAGFHDPAAPRFSEEFQAEYYRQTLAMAAKIPFLRGMSPGNAAGTGIFHDRPPVALVEDLSALLHGTARFS